MSSDKPLKPVSSEQAAFDFGVKLARGEQGVPGGAAKEEGAAETKGGEGAVEDPHGLAQKIERFDPNKLLKKDGGITSDPKECDEVGYPYNLVGSGASPAELTQILKDLEATYKEPIVKGAPDYEPEVQVEYVPDRVEIDPIPRCMKELFEEADRDGLSPPY